MHHRCANKFADVQAEVFRNTLTERAVPTYTGNIEEWSGLLCESLYDAASGSKSAQPANLQSGTDNRWSAALRRGNSREIWKAIDWAGDTAGGCRGSADRPTDGDFKQHFEELLGSVDYTLETDAVTSDVSIPILDDQITPMEVDQCIRSLKTDKSAGPDGIAPELFRLLPVEWVVLVASILNTVFISGTYPPSWCFAKLCVLFKKGNRRLCENYSGTVLVL